MHHSAGLFSSSDTLHVTESILPVLQATFPRRVLVVDDYRESRFVTCVALTLRGHTCGHVGTASAALASIETFRPDVVVIEWALRDGSGRGLADEVRRVAAELGQRVRVIAVSSQPEPLAAAERFDRYLSKPVVMDELDQLICATRSPTAES
jgi:two-component system OmpR family response regulator